MGVGLLFGGGLGALAAAALTNDDSRIGEHLLLGAAGGAVAGMAISGGAKKALSLEQSLRIALQQLRINFVSLRRHGRYQAQLVFQTDQHGFRVVKAQADASREWSSEKLDDWIYRELVFSVAKAIKAAP